MGAPRGGRRARLRAALRGRSRQEEQGRGAEAGAEGRRRAAARDGRRPRRRGDRLAPARGAAARRSRFGGWSSTRSPRTRSSGALGETRAVDQRLVDAQETRRILDRLYGYEVSPVLWKKVMQGLSAGRVQSVAVRLVVERERERRAFVAAGYWDISGRFDPGSFEARLAALDGKRVAQGRDFAQDGTLKGAELARLDEPEARSLAAELDGATFAVRSADEKPYTRRPAAPFMTSTLQQEASRKLRYSAQTTMRVAQKLYENGYITYMRTDSTTLSESALAAARRQAVELYGPDSIPEQPRRYARKVKNAQEAHEAIRPAGDDFRTPKDLARELNRDELRALRPDLEADARLADGRRARPDRFAAPRRDDVESGRDAEFSASGTVITFRGFLAAYEESRDDDVERGGGAPAPAPAARRRGARARARAARATRRARPPATPRRASSRRSRSAASAARRPTRRSSARSSTAATSSSAAPRSCLRSSPSRSPGCSSSTSSGSSTTTSRPSSRTTSTGSPRATRSGSTGCGASTSAAESTATRACTRSSPTSPTSTRARSTRCRSVRASSLRVGRYGPYVERGEERASVPEDLAPDELTVEKAEELLSAPAGDRSLGVHPETGPRDRRQDRPLRAVRDRGARRGRHGEAARRLALQDDVARDGDARRGASRLLSLPRTLGADPADGEEITAQNGRYGPYVKKGADSRSLESEEQLFTITLEEALELLSKPKERRGRGAPKPPLKEVGPDPGQRQAGRRQGGPLRAVRHRRRDEREPAARRRPGDDDDRAGGGAARRPALEGPGAKKPSARRVPRRSAA